MVCCSVDLIVFFSLCPSKKTSELASLKKLNHQNILKLIDSELNAHFIEDEQKKEVAVMVLELAPNGELLDYLMYTGSFSDEVARTYFKQLASDIDACHNAGIVHRFDTKPHCACVALFLFLPR